MSVMSSCYYDNEEDLYEDYYAAQQCDTVNVSYQESVKPIIETNCLNPTCHKAGGGAPGIFTNYAGVREKVDDGTFYQRTIIDRDMPPRDRPALNNCQLSLIKAWIDQGARNN